ncbi:MAG: hypothetical protein U0791_18765 [Gemmataceae bacterium]
MAQPPLVPIHADESLVASKLEGCRKLSTEALLDSLQPGTEHALRARPDGTLLNGHHRIKVLRERGFDVDALPRELIEKEPLPED